MGAAEGKLIKDLKIKVSNVFGITSDSEKKFVFVVLALRSEMFKNYFDKAKWTFCYVCIL